MNILLWVRPVLGGSSPFAPFAVFALALFFLAACGASPSPSANVSNGAITKSPVPDAPSGPDISFPSSPVGEAAAAWLHAVNDASREETLAFYKTRYAKSLLDVPRGAAEIRRDVVHNLRAFDGRRHVRAIERASAVAEKITIHQLLTHTSGLGDYFTD
jgi:Beta-lactamase